MIPNCVPEYYHELQERYDHECELAAERNDWYESNREYREKRESEGCAVLQFPPDECEGCEHGENAMPIDEWDDIPTIICDKCWRTCAAFRRSVKESWPNESWETISGWFGGGVSEI